MLARHHPAALTREAALYVFDELERLHHRERQLMRLVAGLRGLLADVTAPSAA
jgi:hypothetical protein